MIRKVFALACALTLAACSTPGSRDRYHRLLTPTANPSDVVATELAFARAAQEDGQWTAFREYSTDDAVMFVPEAVNAHDWLSKQQNPAQAVKWQPHQVWSSCDGSLAVTKGAWQRSDGSVGYFTTIWERQRNGDYRWVLDQGDSLTKSLNAPDFIQTQVGDCDVDAIMVTADGPEVQFDGRSKDKSLSWRMNVYDDLSRDLAVYLSRNGKLERVIESRVAPPAN